MNAASHPISIRQGRILRQCYRLSGSLSYTFTWLQTPANRRWAESLSQPVGTEVTDSYRKNLRMIMFMSFRLEDAETRYSTEREPQPRDRHPRWRWPDGQTRLSEYKTQRRAVQVQCYQEDCRRGYHNGRGPGGGQRPVGVEQMAPVVATPHP